MKRFAALILAGAIIFSVPASAQNFGSIQSTLGTGVINNGVLILEFPRNDLAIKVNETQLSPEIGVESVVMFQQVTSQMLQGAAFTGVTTTGPRGFTRMTSTTGPTGFTRMTTTTGRIGFTGATTTGRTGFATTTGITPGAATLQAGQMVMLADLCVTEAEEPRVIDQLHKDALTITAIHEHFIGETPNIRFIHVEGAGDGAQLAQKIRNSLSIIGTTTATTGAASSMAQFSGITGVMGTANATTAGNVLKFSIPTENSFTLGGLSLSPVMGATATANFQLESSTSAIANVEIPVQAKAADRVIQSLRANNFAVAALHNHTLDESPRTFYVHALGTGAPGTLAQNVQDAINIAGANRGAHPVLGNISTALGNGTTVTTGGTM